MVKFYTNNYNHNVKIVNGKIINEEEEKLFYNNIDNNNNYYTKTVNNNIINHEKITEKNLHEYLNNFNKYLLDMDLFITPELYLEAEKKIFIDNQPTYTHKNFLKDINIKNDNDSDIDTNELIKEGEKILKDFGKININDSDSDIDTDELIKEGKKVFGNINDSDSDIDTDELIKEGKKVLGNINDSDNEIIKKGKKVFGKINDNDKKKNPEEIIKSGDKILGGNGIMNKISDKDKSNIYQSDIDNKLYPAVENKNIKFKKNDLSDIKPNIDINECKRIENKYELKNIEKKKKMKDIYLKKINSKEFNSINNDYNFYINNNNCP